MFVLTLNDAGIKWFLLTIVFYVNLFHNSSFNFRINQDLYESIPPKYLLDNFIVGLSKYDNFDFYMIVQLCHLKAFTMFPYTDRWTEQLKNILVPLRSLKITKRDGLMCGQKDHCIRERRKNRRIDR